METKAQKAALAHIIAHIAPPQGTLSLKNICSIIEEYNLEKGALNEIYEALMEKSRYDDAANLAKYYGL